MNKQEFRHLVLLIGTNPLPNFIAAEYFLKINPNLKTLWLLHSEANQLQAQTFTQAQNLENLLSSRWENSRELDYQKVALSDVSNASVIRDDVERKMISKINVRDGIHLNYTGGTKSMSTHVYQIIMNRVKGDDDFSYIDSRNYRLILDSGKVLEGNLREKISLNFQELIGLHGFERKNKPKNFIFSDSLAVFGELIETDRVPFFYENAKKGGYNRNLFHKRKGSLAENKGSISEENNEVLKEFEPDETFLSVIMAMPEEYRLFDREGNFNTAISSTNFKKAIGFLDGDWLEHIVAETISDKLKDSNITIDQNWVIRNPDWEGHLDFELDVIMLQGYQFTGISCTTDASKKLCKSKGFEIIHRSRQIGGDEAKAVLVSRLNNQNTKLVQQELKHETGIPAGNILVLGEADLKQKRLLRKIQEFVISE